MPNLITPRERVDSAVHEDGEKISISEASVASELPKGGLFGLRGFVKALHRNLLRLILAIACQDVFTIHFHAL